MKLEIKAIRYFETNRGLGYQCKTNVKGIEVHNDGDMGSTYLVGNYGKICKLGFDKLGEWDLEDKINDFERVGKYCI